jgi:adenylosuccinate synthase
MPRATVVIGANYGDEGKGLMVDYFTSQAGAGAVVVRFNGGSQAGHTVVSPDGKRHVFSHFGSGTLVGAATYLAKHFVCNPLLFWKELRELDVLGIKPVVAADPRCFVTTPYDMLVNQAVEDARADKRHGSVGLGFGETIERNQYPAFQLWKADLGDRSKLKERLASIRDHWFPLRCGQHGVPALPRTDPRMSDEILEKTTQACTSFNELVTTAGAEYIERRPVIFEGAQGLALDMDSVNFPHVTRSNTGLKNVAPLAKGLGLTLDVVYVTRPYLTKHGAGPLATQYEPDPPLVDDTNTDHPYQGKLRFGRLDVAEMRERIAHDLSFWPSARESVALTHIDQISAEQAAEMKSRMGGVRFISTGPQRNHVGEII